jgi:hypothetical protein
MLYYKVQKGYAISDYITIDDTELPMAMRAMGKGQVAVFKEGTVSGSHIISITPDWNKVMGYNRDYLMNGEDMREIPFEIKNKTQKFLEETSISVSRQLQGLPPLEKIEGTQMSDERKSLADKFKI